MSLPPKTITSSDSDIAKFNYNVSILIFQLSKIYPDDNDLKLWAEKFEWSKSFNAYMACEHFMKVAENCVDEIMLEKEDFFLEKDYQNLDPQYQKYAYLIYKCADLWQSNVNDKLKKNIWKIIQTLLTYGIKAKKRRDLVSTLNKYREIPLKL